MTEAMPFLQKYDITFLRPPTIMSGLLVFVGLSGSGGDILHVAICAMNREVTPQIGLRPSIPLLYCAAVRNLCQAGAARENVLIEILGTGRKADGSQAGAVQESVVIDKSGTVLDGDGGQIGTASEGTIINHIDAARDTDGSQPGAVLESGFAASRDTIQERDRSQPGASRKGVTAKRTIRTETAWDRDRRQPGTV